MCPVRTLGLNGSEADIEKVVEQAALRRAYLRSLRLANLWRLRMAIS
mgnify:CR=1 FL=1